MTTSPPPPASKAHDADVVADADLEAAIERRLQSWNPSANNSSAPKPRAPTRRRRRNRSRAAKLSQPADPPPPPSAPPHAPSAPSAPPVSPARDSQSLPTPPDSDPPLNGAVTAAAASASAAATRRAAALSLVQPRTTSAAAAASASPVARVHRRRRAAALQKSAPAADADDGGPRVVRAADLPLALPSKNSAPSSSSSPSFSSYSFSSSLSRLPAPLKPAKTIRKDARSAAASEETDAAAFVDAHRREVSRFGAAGLDKRARREMETAELVRLGCRPPPNQKMPIWQLQARRARKKELDRQQRKEARETGMLVRSKRKRR